MQDVKNRKTRLGFVILFLFFKSYSLTHILYLDLIDVSLIHHLLNLVQETRGDAQESFNYDTIRLILVFNEQYMMSGSTENLCLDVLSRRIGTSDMFSANLIFMLNRSSKER